MDDLLDHVGRTDGSCDHNDHAEPEHEDRKPVVTSIGLAPNVGRLGDRCEEHVDRGQPVGVARTPTPEPDRPRSRGCNLGGPTGYLITPCGRRPRDDARADAGIPDQGIPDGDCHASKTPLPRGMVAAVTKTRCISVLVHITESATRKYEVTNRRPLRTFGLPTSLPRPPARTSPRQYAGRARLGSGGVLPHAEPDPGRPTPGRSCRS
jgi:hypothetical protein